MKPPQADSETIELSQSLRESISSAQSSTRRPVLHHLNADSSWLFQIPRPENAPSDDGRKYFNVLIDPWLSGSQSDVASFFSKQWHAITPKYNNVKAVEALIWEVERVVDGGEQSGKSYIDAIAISHEFTGN